MIFYSILLYDMILFDIVLYDIVFYDIIVYDIVLYDIMLYDILLYDIISYDIILYSILSAESWVACRGGPQQAPKGYPERFGLLEPPAQNPGRCPKPLNRRWTLPGTPWTPWTPPFLFLTFFSPDCSQTPLDRPASPLDRPRQPWTPWTALPPHK